MPNYDESRWIKHPDGTKTRRLAAPVGKEDAFTNKVIEQIEENMHLPGRADPTMGELVPHEEIEEVTGESTSAEDEVNATSAAIEYAAEKGISLEGIRGTGKNGKILKSDVEAAIS